MGLILCKLFETTFLNLLTNILEETFMGKLCKVSLASFEYCDAVIVRAFVHGSQYYVALSDIFNVLGLNMRNAYHVRRFTDREHFSSTSVGIAKFVAVPVRSLIEDLSRYKSGCRRANGGRVDRLIEWLYRIPDHAANSKNKKSADVSLNYGVGMIEHNVSGNLLRELTRDYIQRTYRDTANLMPDQSLFVLSDISRILKLGKPARANGFTVMYANVPTSAGYASQRLCCTESSLRHYLQYRSRKPEACELLKWLDSRFDAADPAENQSTVEVAGKSPIAVISATTKDCIAELKAIRDRVDSLIVDLGGLV